MKYFYCKNSIIGMLELVPSSYYAMQRVVAKIACRPNQPSVDTGNSGEFHDDVKCLMMLFL